MTILLVLPSCISAMFLSNPFLLFSFFLSLLLFFFFLFFSFSLLSFFYLFLRSLSSFFFFFIYLYFSGVSSVAKGERYHLIMWFKKSDCFFPFLSLNDPLKLHILSFLPPSDLLLFGQSCKEYQTTSSSRLLWEPLYKEYFVRGEITKAMTNLKYKGKYEKIPQPCDKAAFGSAYVDCSMASFSPFFIFPSFFSSFLLLLFLSPSFFFLSFNNV